MIISRCIFSLLSSSSDRSRDGAARDIEDANDKVFCQNLVKRDRERIARDYTREGGNNGLAREYPMREYSMRRIHKL
jgi:hypothetical protein